MQHGQKMQHGHKRGGEPVACSTDTGCAASGEERLRAHANPGMLAQAKRQTSANGPAIPESCSWQPQQCDLHAQRNSGAPSTMYVHHAGTMPHPCPPTRAHPPVPTHP